MTQPLKTGLVGFGRVAQTMHAPLIHQEPLLDLTAVVERHHQKSKEKYPAVTVYRSLEALLAEADVSFTESLGPEYVGRMMLAMVPCNEGDLDKKAADMRNFEAMTLKEDDGEDEEDEAENGGRLCPPNC